MTEDRRRYYRWSCKIPCQFRSGSELLMGTVTNLSFNGARVEGRGWTPAVETRFMLVMEPADRAIGLLAQVIYAKDDALGLMFVEPRQTVVERLMPYFRDRIDVEFDPSKPDI